MASSLPATVTSSRSVNSQVHSQTRPESADAMMKLYLKDLAADALRTNSYFQTESIRQAKAQLSFAKEPVMRLMMQLDLANDLRRIGDNAGAVEQLEQALSLIDQHQMQLKRDQSERLMFQAGVTYLRMAETENCVYCRTGESCILPIVGGGIHTKQEGSRKAALYFERVLKVNPDHYAARWLLNVARMTLGEYPDNVAPELRVDPSKFRDSANFPRFNDVAAERGVKTVNCGGGAIAEDFDGDGDFDLLTSTWDPSGQIHFFLNNGAGHFTDATEAAGLIGITGGINMVQADYDNDGDSDVFLVRGAWLGAAGRYPNSLLRNNGQGQFEDVTFDVGMGPPFYPTSSAAWFDHDNDGDLDLFVANESAPCQLFLNEGRDGFIDIAVSAGVTNLRFTKGVTCGDVNRDGLMDLYLSNLGGENRLFINSGNGTYVDLAHEYGVAEPIDSFPTWFWDVNNDGYLDLFVASYKVSINDIAAEYFDKPHNNPRDRLYLGGPDGFHEAGETFGLTAITEPMGSNFGDLDNDGWLDFHLGTGYPEYEALMPNLMFHNQSGTKFESVSHAGGFAHLQKGHGTVFCDFDADGDQDVFVQMGGAYPGDAFGDVLYENPGFGNGEIRIKVVGTTSNRSAIGARIEVECEELGERRTIYRWVNSGGSFGANSLQQHIGIGTATLVKEVRVTWPATGKSTAIKDIKAGSLVVITEP